MIIVLEPKTPEKQIKEIAKGILAHGDITIQYNYGSSYTVLALIGDTSKIDETHLVANKCVHKVMRIQEPYKRANRLFQQESTIIDVGGHKIGGNDIVVMAGPCSVESRDSIIALAHKVKAAGAHFLRGGAFKPRSSPYSFQGLGREGIEYLSIAKAETGLPVVTEIMSIDTLDAFDDMDIIQVGARNMQNFTLLKELGKTDKPILLKRGLSSTIEEWLMSAEYIISEGNTKVILCERGIRTFETFTRNTLDLSAIPVVKRMSHLPIIIDPSHATGLWWMVESLAKGAIATGTDGIMLEVHEDPPKAISDAAQTINVETFDSLMKEMAVIATAVGRNIEL